MSSRDDASFAARRNSGRRRASGKDDGRQTVDEEAAPDPTVLRQSWRKKSSALAGQLEAKKPRAMFRQRCGSRMMRARLRDAHDDSSPWFSVLKARHVQQKVLEMPEVSVTAGLPLFPGLPKICFEKWSKSPKSRVGSEGRGGKNRLRSRSLTCCAVACAISLSQAHSLE